MITRCIRGFVVVAVAGALAASSTVGAGAATKSSSSDTAIAKQGVLVSADFPAEWTATPSKASSDAATEKVAATIPDCKQYIVFEKSVKAVPRAKSPDFDLGNSSISNTTSVFTNAARATSAMRVFQSSKTESCINKLFSKLVTTKDVTFTGHIQSVALGVGSQSVGYAGTITASSSASNTQTFGVGLFAIRTGRGVGMYSYFSDTDETTVLSDAINTSMTRFQAALAA